MDAKLLFLAFVTSAFCTSVNVIEKYVTLCKRSDPNLNECYVKIFNLMMAHMEKGLPDLGLMKVDSVNIDEIKLNLGSGSSKFDVVLTNLMLFGLKDTKATKMNIDLNTLDFQLRNSVPEIYAVTQYNGKGKVLLFELDSSGTLYLNISDVTSTLTGKNPKLKEKDGKHYASWDFDLDLNVKKLHMYYDNLLPDEEMNKNVNEALNANMDLLYQDLKPTLEKSMLAIISDLTNKFYSKFAIEDLFPE